MVIILMILFFFPPIFQITTGLKALKRNIKMSFWVVSVVSIVSQILITSAFLSSMKHNMEEFGNRDGLGIVVAAWLGIAMTVIILLVIATQLMIHWVNKKKTANL
jgi:hypothetical protein